jgi:uncharacterized RDD family membrane protein YckC
MKLPTRLLGRKAKRLYDFCVCGKCWNSFSSRRELAYLIDWVIYYILLLLFMFALEAAYVSLFLENPLGPSPVFAFNFLFLFGGRVLFLFRDAFNGRGPGKLLCGLRVVNEERYQPCSLVDSIKRNLPLIVPYVALVLLFMIGKGKRWGDGWAKTKVIWIKHEFKLPFDQRGIRCLACGYDLTGNVSGRCPECGTAVPEGAVAPLVDAVQAEGLG